MTPEAAFRADVLAGLRQTPKVVPARWLYDAAGSALFEQITALPEYYPTRTETALLTAHAAEIAALTGPGRLLLEPGSGSSAKTGLLIEAVKPAAYVPVDISPTALDAAVSRLRDRFPALTIRPLTADFTRDLPLDTSDPRLPALGFFPGSTIGNFAPREAVDLLRRFADALGPDALLLIGIDPPKETAVLEAAYDDAAGVTARFNLNLLMRINRELGGTVDPGAFRHRARWNAAQSRIEMHLEALRPVEFTVAGQSFELAAADTIHTENSYKYAPADAALLARAGGWEPVRLWQDAAHLFTVQLWARPPARLDP